VGVDNCPGDVIASIKTLNEELQGSIRSGLVKKNEAGTRREVLAVKGGRKRR